MELDVARGLLMVLCEVKREGDEHNVRMNGPEGRPEEQESS